MKVLILNGSISGKDGNTLHLQKKYYLTSILEYMEIFDGFFIEVK